MKIFVIEEGVTTDVTFAVQVIYDALLASMDYSSGFLDAEELTALHELGTAAGFKEVEEVYEHIQAAKAQQERWEVKMAAIKGRYRAPLVTVDPSVKAELYQQIVEQVQSRSSREPEPPFEPVEPEIP